MPWLQNQINKADSLNPYIAVNILLATLIVCIFSYSAIFSPEKNNHPIKCQYRAKYHKPCPTCGLSRSFSAVIRGNIFKARQYNANGPLIFFFFAIQLTMRLLINSIIRKYGNSTWLVGSDVALSLSLFIFCFWGVIIELI